MLQAVRSNQPKHRILDNRIQILQFLEANHLDVDKGKFVKDEVKMMRFHYSPF